MKFNPTPAAIAQFKNNFVLPNGQPNKQMQDLVMNKIRPGIPIAAETMTLLLANISSIGVPAYKPGVSSIQVHLHCNWAVAHPQSEPNHQVLNDELSTIHKKKSSS